MKDISEQFYGEFTEAPWIEDSIKNIKGLIVKEAPDSETINNIPDIWMIGPRESDHKRLYLLGIGKGHFTKKIDAIYDPLIGINIDDKSETESPYILIRCQLTWYKLYFKNSLTCILKILDLFIHDSFSDIVPLSDNDLFNELRSDLYE